MSADLSPCSSCETLIQSVHGPTLTISLPNLVDRCTLSTDALEHFVFEKTGQHVDVTVAHLLLYLFSTHSGPRAPHVNYIKLLHRGQPHSLQRHGDLQQRRPPLAELAQTFPTFQLVVVPHISCPPLTASLEHMLQRVNNAQGSRDSATTYAEAMIKYLRRRRSSVSSGTATRFLSRDSTDVEDSGENRVAKLKSSMKRALRRTNHFVMDLH